MSQSGRFITDQPVPGAGIQTVTGNVGGAVPGDGVANVNLVGAGTITVTGNPGANTLTISSTALPATYTTDTGAAVPDGAGNLNVLGGTNINTDNAAANTVAINLDDNVVLAGSLQAGTTITAVAGDITATAGDIVAANGNIIATGIVYGIAGGRFDDQVNITANGLESTGPTVLNDLNRGVVQVNDAHTLFSDEGADGQVLIGSTVGSAAWRNIVGAGGVVIGNGANSIAISADATVPQNFLADIGNAVPVAGTLRVYGGTNINTVAAGNTIDINLDPSISLAGTLQVDGKSTFNNDVTMTATHKLTAFLGDISYVDSIYVVTTEVKISGEGNGALVTNADGNVYGVNGAAGTVLTANPGGTPSFQPNAAISGASYSSFFARQVGDTVDVTDDGSANYIWLGAPAILTTAAGDCFNTGGNLTLGDGLGTSAKYTAPSDGTYYFNFQAALSSSAVQTYISFCINNITHGFSYFDSKYINGSPTLGRYPAWGSFNTYIKLTAGDQVQFGVNIYRAGLALPVARLHSVLPISNNADQFVAQTFISGHRVA